MNDTMNVGTEEGAACTPTQYCIEYLRELANGRAPDAYWYGICWNLTLAIRSAGFCDPMSGYDIVIKHAPQWPEFSGDVEYPVQCSMYDVDGQRTAYVENDLWVGEYGAARRRLAGFIADELEKGLLE